MTPAEIHAHVLAGIDDERKGAERLQQHRPGPWTFDPDYAGEPAGGTAIYDTNGQLVAVVRGGIPAEWIAAHNPATVLRVLTGHRNIIERHAPAWENGAGVVYCDWCAAGRQVIKAAAWPCLDYRDAAADLLPEDTADV